MTILVIVLSFCLIMSGVFSAIETAFTSLSPGQIEKLAYKKKKRGKMVKKLAYSQDILLTTILIGNNLVNIGASAIATSITIELFGSSAVGIMTGILTLFILIFGEVTPKQIAFVKNESISLSSAHLIWILSYIFRPIIWFITLFSKTILRLLKVKKENRMTIENILHTVDVAEDRGLVDNYENQVVRNILRLNNISINSFLTHRTEVFSLSWDTSPEECASKVIKKGFTRIPVYDTDPENIVGIVMQKDILLNNTSKKPLREFMTPPLFVSTSRKAYPLFLLLKKKQINIAVVLDEYGGLAGIVTREDVIEEILGELYDEDEVVENERIIDLKNGSFRIHGETSFYGIEDFLKIHLEHGNKVRTISGYIIEKTGAIPSQDDVFTFKEGKYIIEKVNNNCIKQILFTPSLDYQE